MTFFFLVIATLITSFYSCKTNTDDLWDSIHQLDGRVTSLEELCKQMNGNISSLQKLVQALQDNNSITMVTPVKQGDKTIGYTISFTKGEPITIYHGEKGDKGEQGDKGETGDKGDTGNNGKDGTTPTIGVKQHADGIYYWTLNGDWLRDNSGNMIKAEGKDGTDGEQGEEGKEGTTPQLKIENGYWWVSYGEESGWIQLDKAVADNGETIFKEVTQDDDYAYFTLIIVR
ncbi:PL29 family lyase N-terminal domain-containing protein [Bacteroides acidifaciens]|uniref:PL29 family lyase N-terminal domain-containing protein n=1 Tax=Bacteroides acidifaciens TaxID=85831 RepID=UPI001FF092B3|nr:PL29 family lyase N-terminal domain-containing protein [Bacteroides acidifaciens]